MEIPASIGGLKVERVLGEGGMGRVYLCHDDGLQRDVAVKVLLPSLLSDELMRERFLREARALARVKSDGIVSVYAVGDDDEAGPYVVMERLEGEDVLQRLQREGSLSVDEVLRIGVAVARGLADVHAAQVLHRDIKPANLFRQHDGRVVLTDFGLAKRLPREEPAAPAAAGLQSIPDTQLTKPNVVVGTPAYLAPELARGQAASPSSDLYALGATLYHLLAGGPPFDGDTALDVLSRAVVDPAPRVSSERLGVPTALDVLIAQLLEKTPDLRPKSAAAVAERLEAIRTGADDGSLLGAVDDDGPRPVAQVVTANGKTAVLGSLSEAPTRAALLAPPSAAEPSAGKRAALIAVVLFFLAGALVVGLSRDDRRARINKGEAAAVLAELEQIPEAERRPEDLVLLGLALRAQDRGADAWKHWAAVLEQGYVDDDIKAAAFADIEERQAKAAADALGAWPEDIDSELRARLDDSWWPRHHALNALEARKSATDDDRERVGLTDLGANDCSARKYGVMLLKRGGHTQKALDGLRRLREALPSNLCLAFELGSAEDAVRKRLDER